jgi:hypothetical protein
MEEHFFKKNVSSVIPEKLREKFLRDPFFTVDDCVFFRYMWKPESGRVLNFERYGDRTGCEVSINGFHIRDFCEDKNMAIPVAFLFLKEFIRLWRDNFQCGVVIYFGLIPEDDEFGPDVTFSFHKNRKNEAWTNLDDLGDSPEYMMVVEI